MTAVTATPTLVILVMLAACSPASPARGAASPAPVAHAPLPVACRLPVIVPISTPEQRSQGIDPTTYQAGFVTFPAGQLTADPQGGFTFDSNSVSWISVAQPVLHGTSRIGYYDRAFHRWLPAGPTQVSPDESRYAYVDAVQGGLYSSGRIHVVDVATGRDRTLDVPISPYRIFEFGQDGIYVNNYGGLGRAGLWLIDPDSGAIRQLFNDGWVEAVRDGAAWVAASAQDHHPTSNMPGGDAGPPSPPVISLLMRRDLTSGSTETWLNRPGTNLYVQGIYGPPFLVWVNSPGSDEYVLLSGPGSALDLNFSGDPLKNPWTLTAVRGLGFVDQHGIWLGGDAIYLYTSQTGLRQVAAVPGYPSNTCA